MANVRMTTQEDLDAYAFDVATDAQREVLARMSKFGWRISKVLGRRGQPANVALSTKGQGVWLQPDGTVVRPKPGCKSARIRV